MAGNVHETAKVCVEHVIPFAQIRLLGLCRMVPASTVHQEVQTAKEIDSVRDRISEIIDSRHIDCDRDGLPTGVMTMPANIVQFLGVSASKTDGDASPG
jgi:hypothetical protein